MTTASISLSRWRRTTTPRPWNPLAGQIRGLVELYATSSPFSARPVACTDVLCFGPQDLPRDRLPGGVLHPARVQDGVVAGIGDYGNKLGLPTVKRRGGLRRGLRRESSRLLRLGRSAAQGRARDATAGRRLDSSLGGGRTGRDGIHGATFSSAELTQSTHLEAGSAVQIGDPITEKGLIELVEAARDERLYKRDNRLRRRRALLRGRRDGRDAGRGG